MLRPGNSTQAVPTMARRVRSAWFTGVTVLSILSLWLLHYNFKLETQEKPIHVLILTSWRSGSSFLGQIFNHHPDVFYVYEPARMVWVKLPSENPSLLHYPIRDLLRSLYNCDMSPLHHYLPRNGRYISDLPFWAESRALCFPPACQASDIKEYDRPTCFQRCGYVPLEKMAEACRVHSHVVLKTVRVMDLRVLLPLLQDPNLDLRIVHLVRDPRAVAFSRINFPLLHQEDLQIVNEKEKHAKPNKISPNVTRVMEEICRAQVAIHDFCRTAPSSLKGRYMMVRHEDLAMEPLSTVEKLYQFAGLGLSADTERWIYNITHKSRKSQAGFMNFAEESMKIIQKWRSGLDHNIVLEIQDKCREAMEVFGYRPVSSSEEQKGER